ncbi:MAG: hypothetical protein ACLQJR_23190 [Stellaceae bacterium]
MGDNILIVASGHGKVQAMKVDGRKASQARTEAFRFKFVKAVFA